MLWVRFEKGGKAGFGALEGGRVTPYTGDPFAGDACPAGDAFARDAARLLAPTAPSKMPALWNNYRALAQEKDLKEPSTPLYLLKSPSSFLGPDEDIRHPPHYTGEVFFEGELGIVIGRVARDVTPEEAPAHIFGYTCINDVTAFGLLKDYPGFDQWTRAKGFDTFGVFGPAICDDLDWRVAEIVTRVDGVEKQRYPASDMILPPPAVVSALSRDMTLLPGDVICCGTSVGLGPMPRGCRVEVEIAGIGVLANRYR